MNVIFCLSVDIVGRGRDKCKSAGDQRKLQQNSQKYPAIVGFCLGIINDYGVYSILKPPVENHLRTRTPTKTACSVDCLSDERGVIITWSASLLRLVGTG